jgi:predicted secreted Zn-dependent protease
MQTGAYLIKGDGSYDYIADAPPVTWRTYEVHGTTTDEIRASLDANSPQVRGVHYDALTWFNPNWRWWVRGPYGCYLDWSQASYAAVVTLPVLVNDKPIAPDLQARWDIYSDALKAREVEHLKAAPDYMDRLVRTLKSSDCAHANNAAWREWYKIRREELRFYSQDELSFP